MIDADYEYLQCRDLRHAWRGQLEHRLVELPKPRRRSSDLRADYLLVRTVVCATCGTVRAESFAVRQLRDGTYLIGERVRTGYSYPDGYRQHGRIPAADFRVEALTRVLREGRATLIHPEEE